MSGELAQEFCSEKINPVLQKGLTELCRAKPADPIVSCGTADARAFLRHRPLFVDNPLSFPLCHTLSLATMVPPAVSVLPFLSMACLPPPPPLLFR